MHRAWQQLDEMELNNVRPDLKVFTAILNNCYLHHNAPEAMEAIRRMKQRNIVPTQYILNQALNTCILTDELQSTSYFANLLYTNFLLTVPFCLLNPGVDLLLKEFEDQQIPMPQDTILSLLTSAARKADYVVAEKLWDKLTNNTGNERPSYTAYNALLYAYTNAKEFAKVFATISKMASEGTFELGYAYVI